jgi:excisionase family DNA binding protein
MGLVLRHVPVAEAAAQLGISRQRVYELVREGKLGYVRSGRTILISAQAIRERKGVIEQRLYDGR